MRLDFGFAVLVAALSNAVSLPRPKPMTGPGFLQVPVTAVNKTSKLSKRQAGTPLYNPDFGLDYLVHISIGTPPQPVDIVLDTGSSEAWVNPTCSQASTPYQVTECEAYPIYNPGASSSATDLGAPFSLSYGKGSSSGEYLEDNFLVGGASITNLQFGYATASTKMTTGILGVSYGVEITGYYCVIDQMYLQGVIASRAFALDLGSVDSAAGSITFGGIDTMKYTGPLEKRPIIGPLDAPDGNIRYWIYMTSVGITPPGATKSSLFTVPPPAYQQPVVLDSGSTLSTLPANLVAVMLAQFTGVTSLGNGVYSVDCNQTTLSGTLDFGFGNTVINVPYHQFIWQTGSGCIFGAIGADPTTYDTWILGDTVMRSMYAVFDQDNGNLLVANYVNCGTNLVPIGSGVDAVPSITGACKPTSTVSTSSSTSSSVSSTKSSTTTSSLKTTTSSSVSGIKTTSTTSSSLKSTTSSSVSSQKSTSTTSSSVSSQKSTSTSSSLKSTSSSTRTSTSSTKSTSSSVTSTSSVKIVSSTSSVKTVSSTLVTTTSSKTSTSVSSATTATKTLGYAYVGCYKDSKGTALTKLVSNSSMSVELCLGVALQAKPPYPYAGVENGKECWAALTSPAAATPTSGTKACTVPCTANTHESCGGRSMFNLYYSTAG